MDAAERRLKDAARKLAQARFQSGVNGVGEHVFWSEHHGGEFLDVRDVPARILELAEADISAIVESGMLGGEFELVHMRGRGAPPRVK